MFPNVSLESLLCALVLSEEGNLSRTANRLNTSVSNVGRKVRTLQTTWNIELFKRNLAGFDLTDEGRVFVPELRHGIEYIQRGFDLARYRAINKQTLFRVGRCPNSHGKTLLFLEKQARTPGGYSRVSVKSATSMQLKARVLRGELQAAFGVMPIVDTDLHVIPLLTEGFSICMSETHLLKDKIRVAARDVAGERIYWIPRSMHPSLYDEVTGYLRGAGVDTSNMREAQTVLERIDCAANGLGVSLVPRSAERFRCPGVLFKSMTDRLPRIETALFARRDQMLDSVGDFVDSAIGQLRPRKIDLS